MAWVLATLIGGPHAGERVTYDAENTNRIDFIDRVGKTNTFTRVPYVTRKFVYEEKVFNVLVHYESTDENVVATMLASLARLRKESKDD